MPSRYTDRIVNHLAHEGYEPAVPAVIANDMHVEAADHAVFDEAVALLLKSRRIETSGKTGVLRLPAFGDEVVGRLRVNRRGFGFVIPDSPYRDGDLFMPPDAMRDAISGDRVRARVMRGDRRGGKQRDSSRATGLVLEVIERGREHFVGTLHKDGSQWFVQPDGRLLAEQVIIRDPGAKNAKDGDKVVIELLHYPDDKYLPEGVITRVLGAAGRPDVETAAVIEAHGLRNDFPEEVVQCARDAAAEFDATPGVSPDREDLTGTFIFTIDPPDAKDFDDAINLEYDAAAGTWTLGVHIADVATFVKSGNAMDVEAMQRGNSVYLPRLVLPMLPEVLSNGVCSLQEGVERNTVSAFVTYDTDGVVIGQRLARTRIKSRKRLTYIEAQALIDGDLKTARQHAKTEPNYTDDLIDAVRKADKLARTLRKRRRSDGMIVLNLPEVELVFDDDGHVVDAVPEDDAFTHTVIEMLMVEANEAVARTFSALGVPLMRRIHPDPVHGDVEALRLYARVANVDLPEKPTRRDLQRLLEKSADTPASRAIHFAVLRTLTKAKYGPALIGHFALASDHYAHFTSPIRRYPDLLVHRVVHAYLDQTDNGRTVPGGRKRDALARMIREDERALDEGALIELGTHCSDTEHEADLAERELREWLVMSFLHDNHIGDEFTAVVTGVTARAVFISIDRFLVEGVVGTSDLHSDGGSRAENWIIGSHGQRLFSRRSGASIGAGDVVQVQIARIDVASRQMELLVTKFPETKHEMTRDTFDKPKRRGNKGGKAGKSRKKGKAKGRK